MGFRKQTNLRTNHVITRVTRGYTRLRVLVTQPGGATETKRDTMTKHLGVYIRVDPIVLG